MPRDENVTQRVGGNRTAIHAAMFSMPRPVGTAIPSPPIYALANFDPADITAQDRGLAVEDQDPHDLRWIREPFLGDAKEHGFVVVHGHTIVPEVDERPNRIAIDTGAYHSGVLTALGIEETERWLLSTVRPAPGG